MRFWLLCWALRCSAPNLGIPKYTLADVSWPLTTCRGATCVWINQLVFCKLYISRPKASLWVLRLFLLAFCAVSSDPMSITVKPFLISNYVSMTNLSCAQPTLFQALGSEDSSLALTSVSEWSKSTETIQNSDGIAAVLRIILLAVFIYFAGWFLHPWQGIVSSCPPPPCNHQLHATINIF